MQRMISLKVLTLLLAASLASNSIAAITSLVSLNENDQVINHAEQSLSISKNGRFLLFRSKEGAIYVRDLIAQKSSFISSTNRFDIAISDNGRYVASINASNYNLEVHDLIANQLTTTINIGINPTSVSLSEDGRYIAFSSEKNDLVANDENGHEDVFIYDTLLSDVSRVSVAGNGAEANGDSYRPTISADGQFVVFVSTASNLGSGDIRSKPYVYIHERATGITSLIARGNSRSLNMSTDNRYIVFDSTNSNLVPGDNNGHRDIFVYDRVTQKITRVSVASNGDEGNGDALDSDISADGRYVVFDSRATNLAVGNTSFSGVYLHDRQSGITSLESLSSNGSQTVGSHSGSPVISADGRYLAFWSTDDAFVPAGVDSTQAIYVRDRGVAGINSVGDTVWKDDNGDGIQNSNESGMSDVKITLLNCQGAELSTTKTDRAGNYKFTQLADGGYKVQFTLLPNYSFSPEKKAGNYLLDSNANIATGISQCYQLNNGQQRLAIDAGMVPDQVSGSGYIGGFIWHDINHDGVQDSTEPGIRNVLGSHDVIVELLTCDGRFIGSTATINTAYYGFTHLLPGEYRLNIKKPVNFRFSPERNSGNYLTDSNVNIVTGLSHCMTIKENQVRTSIDVGLAPIDDAGSDTIVLNKAIYFTADNRLWIRASSDALPAGSAKLTAIISINGVETILGALVWREDKNAYQQLFRNVSDKPDSIIITSEHSGSASGGVQVR